MTQTRTTTHRSDCTRLLAMIQASKAAAPPALPGSAIEPGIYLGISRTIYEDIPAVHATVLKTLVSQSPAHAAWYMREPKDTEALLFGEAFHTATLEPDLFPKRFVLWPDKDAEGKEQRRYGKKWDEFCVANAGRQPLREKDYDVVLAMSERLHSHPEVQQILKRSPRYQEVVLIWRDDHTGLLCKARADILCDDEAPSIVDYKTSANINPWRFAVSAYDFGWHVQAAFYCMGARKLRPDRPLPNFIVPAIEKSGPLDVVVFRLDRPTMRLGWMQAREALDRYIECQKKNSWPGYSDQIVDLTAPAWALNRYGIEVPKGETP